MILHLVLYQPRATATPVECAELTSALEAACHQIPAIQQVRVGKAVNLGMGYKNRSQGQQYDYVAVFQFRDELDLKSYLANDHHRALAEMFWKVCERTTIIDISAVDPLGGGSIDKIGQIG